LRNDHGHDRHVGPIRNAFLAAVINKLARNIPDLVPKIFIPDLEVIETGHDSSILHRLPDHNSNIPDLRSNNIRQSSGFE
jgi:hypothetical protein